MTLEELQAGWPRLARGPFGRETFPIFVQEDGSLIVFPRRWRLADLSNQALGDWQQILRERLRRALHGNLVEGRRVFDVCLWEPFDYLHSPESRKALEAFQKRGSLIPDDLDPDSPD